MPILVASSGIVIPGCPWMRASASAPRLPPPLRRPGPRLAAGLALDFAAARVVLAAPLGAFLEPRGDPAHDGAHPRGAVRVRTLRSWRPGCPLGLSRRPLVARTRPPRTSALPAGHLSPCASSQENQSRARPPNRVRKTRTYTGCRPGTVLTVMHAANVIPEFR
jgi:hypothetical protein